MTEVSREELRIRWDAGQRDSLYRPRDHQRSGQLLQLDYAATTQRTQGVTAEQAFVLPGPEQGLEALYSAFSRAREETTVVLDRHSWAERRTELGPQGQEALDQAQLVARLAVRASQSELKRGALDASAGSPTGARVEAAQAKLLAYSRAVIQTRQVFLGGHAYFRREDGARCVIRNLVHWHSEYLEAFVAAGLQIRQCLEPRYTAEIVESFIREGSTPANEHLLGLPFALIWDLGHEMPGS